MKHFKSLIIIPFFCVLNSCLPDSDIIDEIPLNQTQIVFYSNAQAVLDCGSFNIEIYMDSTFVGNIREAYSYPYQPDCFYSLSTVLVNADTGVHVYYATADCGDHAIWKDSIRVIQDYCHIVFLDAEELLKDPE